MKFIGSQTRLLIDGVLLAAVLLLSHNAYHLLVFLEPSLVGHSNFVKMAGRKQEDLDTLLERRGEAARTEVETLEKKFATAIKTISDVAASVKEEIVPPEVTEKEPEPEEVVVLPVLSGIFQAAELEGHSTIKALLNGRLVKVGDRVDDFMVKRITPKGVNLYRKGRTFFVAGPELQYTRDKSGSGARNESNRKPD